MSLLVLLTVKLSKSLRSSYISGKDVLSSEPSDSRQYWLSRREKYPNLMDVSDTAALFPAGTTRDTYCST